MKQRETILARRRLLPRRVPDLVRRALYAGTYDTPRQHRDGLVIANIVGYLASLSSLSYATTYAMQDGSGLDALIWGNIVSAAVTASVPLVHRFGRAAGALLLTVSLFTTLFYFTSILGRTSGIQLNYIGAAAIAFVVLGLERMRMVLAVLVSAAGLHLATWFLFPGPRAGIDVAPWLLNQLYFFSVISIMAIIGVVIYYAFTLVRDARARSDALLLNILPEMIAERLKAEPERTIADLHDEATVLFADITGFTQLSERLGPHRIVELLDELFTAFDAIAAERGVEKIKTIGDAYMVVAGVPVAHDNHAAAAAELALGMVEAARDMAVRRDLDIQIRVGIATGPVLAGVIGRTKFAYDVWGGTVNLAARLESNGTPGSILLNEEAHDLLCSEYDLTKHGTLDLKGLGPTSAWRLEGHKELADRRAPGHV